MCARWWRQWSRWPVWSWWRSRRTRRLVPRPATDVKLKGGLNDPKDPNIAVLEFLPESVKVATGTTVTWKIAGPEPHSVTFVPPGTEPPTVEQDPSLFTPTPATGPYDGTTMVNSGVLPLGETSQVLKFSMSFAKPGKYTYYCVLHPNMVGTLEVTSGAEDSQQKITKAGNAETKKYLAEGEAAKRKLLAAKPKQTKNSDGSTTYNVELGASTAHTDVLAFAPTPKNVKSGDHVTFVNNSSAPHTASFGGPLVPTVSIAPNVMSAVPGGRPRRSRRACTSTPAGCHPRPSRAPPSPRAATPTTCRRRASTPTSACCTSRAAWRARSTRPEPGFGSPGARPGFGADCGPARGGGVMDRHDRIDEQLANVPLFSGLSKKELRLISQLATYLEEPAGTVLTQEGKPGHEFIIVLNGEIEVRQGGKVVAERGAGSYVGEIALLDHRPRTATVVAKTPVAIEVIGQREFAGLLAEVPELSQQLLATVARRLADLDANHA